MFRTIRSPICRGLTVCAVMGLASGCASLDLPFMTETDPDLEAQSIALSDQQARNFELTQLVDELRRDNASLQRTVERLTQERGRLLKETAEDKTVDRGDAEADTRLRETVLTVPPPPKTPEAIIVAEAEAAPLKSSAVTVESTPRLVEPSFVAAENVFENEATGTSLTTASLLFGVHLASYREPADAVTGWKNFQRENPNLLGLLEPRIERVEIDGRGEFQRLIAGGFSSEEKAADLCDVLKRKKLYCKISPFNGQRLEVSSAGEG
ncbi:MAG: SPOR domain-containing protein [Pseudomonadota bacterium]